MKEKPIYNRIEKISNHGVEQGITTRFFLQMQKMSEYSFIDIDERNYRMGKYMNVVISDFTAFYDLKQEICDIFENYRTGILSGDFIKKDERGIVTINRSLETKLKLRIKDFFIQGRIVINNWAKSGAIDDDFFILNDLLIVKDSNFMKNKNALLDKDKIRRYEYLFEIIELSRAQFLTGFNQIRADIEHKNFEIPNFRNDYIDEQIVFQQPKIFEKDLMELIDYYYNSIFELIETIMVYYLGINAYLNWNGIVTLYEARDYNYKDLRYKFLVLPRQKNENLILLID
jgi:hypothetical protein